MRVCKKLHGGGRNMVSGLYSQGDLPSGDDEKWSGTEGMDDDRKDIHAAVCDLHSVRFVNMSGGGPFDGGVCAVMEVEVARKSQSQQKPVYLIFSPEDSMGLVKSCLGYLEALDADEDFEDFDGDDSGGDVGNI